MIDRRTIVVCVPRPLFLPSALEERAQAVVDAAARRGHDATLVSLPCGSNDPGPTRDGALAWALVDVSDLGTGRIPDAAVCLHPDALFVHHPRRVAWLPQGLEGDDRVARVLRIRRSGETAPRVVPAEADADAVIEAALGAGSRMGHPVVAR